LGTLANGTNFFLAVIISLQIALRAGETLYLLARIDCVVIMEDVAITAVEFQNIVVIEAG